MKPLLSFELTLMYVGDRTGFHLSSLSPRISGDKGDGIENATNGHSQGGGVEKVGATRGHNTPSVEASTGRRLSGSGGGVVIKLFSKSGLRGVIESKGLSLRDGIDGRRGLRGDVDSV